MAETMQYPRDLRVFGALVFLGGTWRSPESWAGGPGKKILKALDNIVSVYNVFEVYNVWGLSGVRGSGCLLSRRTVAH